jgi:hypothetical protein
MKIAPSVAEVLKNHVTLEVGGNRPDVSERVRAAVAVRTRRGAVLSSAPESAVCFLGADESHDNR